MLQTNGNFPFVGVTDGRGKVLVAADGDGVRAVERYDLAEDPEERVNLAQGGPVPPAAAPGAVVDPVLAAPQQSGPWLRWPEELRASGALDALWDLRAGLHGWIARSFEAAAPAGVVRRLAEALSPRADARGEADVQGLLDALGYGGGEGE